MKSKIAELGEARKWGKAPNVVYYYDVFFEEDLLTKWSIGVKKQDPDFLQVGKVLEYEITDQENHKIKRSNPKFQNQTKTVGPITQKAVNALTSTSLIGFLDNFKESDLIFIDIETARAVKKLEIGTPLYDAWEYKNRYNNELERKTGEKTTLEDYFNEKAALYAAFSKIVAIVVGRIKGDTLATKSYALSKANKWNEAPMLNAFNDDVNLFLEKNPSTVFVGWASKTFDEPFLSKRMYVHNIKPNILLDTVHLKPWEKPGVDLKELWQGGAFYPDSLIAATAALGIPSSKSDMDGSMVGEAFYAGEIDKIVTYCKADVLAEANVYRRLAGKSLLTLA